MNPKLHRWLDRALFPLALILVALANYWIFLVVPNERIMGPVQRVFYFHVGSAIACYCAFGVVLIASLAFLGTRQAIYDIVQQAAGEVAFVFCTIVLLSGMIWGHSAWNTWFRWEPRLVTFLLLWLLALSLNVLRSFGNRDRIGAHCAVVGILGAITVPLVIFSIKLMPNLVQLHPEVVENRGLKHPDFITGMFIAMGALVLLQFALIWYRTRIGLLEEKGKSR